LIRGIKLRRLITDLDDQSRPRDAQATLDVTVPTTPGFIRSRQFERVLKEPGGEPRFTTDEEEFLTASQRNDRWERTSSPQNLLRALGVVLIAGAGVGPLYVVRSLRHQAEQANQKADQAAETAADDKLRATVALSLASSADAEKLRAET